jgi:hypothetical protein
MKILRRTDLIVIPPLLCLVTYTKSADTDYRFRMLAITVLVRIIHASPRGADARDDSNTFDYS